MKCVSVEEEKKEGRYQTYTSLYITQILFATYIISKSPSSTTLGCCI